MLVATQWRAIRGRKRASDGFTSASPLGFGITFARDSKMPRRTGYSRTIRVIIKSSITVFGIGFLSTKKDLRFNENVIAATVFDGLLWVGGEASWQWRGLREIDPGGVSVLVFYRMPVRSRPRKGKRDRIVSLCQTTDL